MKVLVTSDKGYIGEVAALRLRATGYTLVGMNTDLSAGCDFGVFAQGSLEICKDIRDVKKKHIEGFGA
jgi:nucleoside-diphosphate-sugar epimerase